MYDEDYEETERCSHCGKVVYSGVVQCPYCNYYTDENGTFGFKDKPTFAQRYRLVGILVVVLLLLSVLGFSIAARFLQ